MSLSKSRFGIGYFRTRVTKNSPNLFDLAFANKTTCIDQGSTQVTSALANIKSRYDHGTAKSIEF